jgi:hypothetical protein
VGGIGGRVSAAIHIDDALLRHPREQHVIREDGLGGGVDFLPDADSRVAARRINVANGPALIFGDSELGGVPCISAQARGGVDREAEIIAQAGTAATLGVIFMEARSPFAGGVELRERGERTAAGDARAGCGGAWDLLGPSFY